MDKNKHKKSTTTISDRLHNHQQTTMPPHYRLRDRYKPNLPDQRKKPNRSQHNNNEPKPRIKTKNETCKKWRKGTEAQWEQYNQELQQQLEKTDITNIDTLTTMIKKCLMNTIGRYTITAGRVKKKQQQKC